MEEQKKGGEIMRILFIALLLLTLVGCAHSNFAGHWPALYYIDSKALAPQNHQQNSIPFINGGLSYTYSLFDW
jgi:hypothetical protein